MHPLTTGHPPKKTRPRKRFSRARDARPGRPSRDRSCGASRRRGPWTGRPGSHCPPCPPCPPFPPCLPVPSARGPAHAGGINPSPSDAGSVNGLRPSRRRQMQAASIACVPPATIQPVIAPSAAQRGITEVAMNGVVALTAARNVLIKPSMA